MLLKVVVCFTLLCSVHSADSFVLAYNKINGTHEYDAEMASFGGKLIDESITGVLNHGEPYDGCKPMKRAPHPSTGMSNISLSVFALVARGQCDFGQKALHAQVAGYSGIIVYNYEGLKSLIKMSTSLPDIQKDEILIPAVLVTYNSAKELNTSFLYYQRGSPYVEIYEGVLNPIQYYLIPFIIVISICFVSLLLFMLVKCLRDRRRTRRSRLSLARLKQLPVKKFEKGNEYDVCAICLDEYEEGDKLRILPCKHAYHCKCVDPWLTSSKRVCPLCKQKVLSDDESSSDSEDEESDDENTPLLSTSTAAASPNAPRWATGFSRQNPILRAFRRNRRQRLISDSSDDTDTESGGENSVSNIRVSSPRITRLSHQQSADIESNGPLLMQHRTSEQESSVVDEVEPCCSYGNRQNGHRRDRSDDYIHSAEVYIEGTTRRSNASITIISDDEKNGSDSVNSSLSASGEYQSIASNQPEAVCSSEPESELVNSGVYQSVDSEEDDDIIVLTQGSHQSQAEEV